MMTGLRRTSIPSLALSGRSVRVLAFVLAEACIFVPLAAHGDVQPYQCGNPVLNPAGDEGINTSDSLRILRKAVDQDVLCMQCVCDVNNAQGISASDALLVLRKAVGQSIVMNCFQSDECTKCDAMSIKNRLETMTSRPAIFDEAGIEGWVNFQCEDTDVITINPADWPDAGVIIGTGASGATISDSIAGETRTSR